VPWDERKKRGRQQKREKKRRSRLSLQPKRVDEIKEFLLLSRRKDVVEVRVYKPKNSKGKKTPPTKFKVRCSKYVIMK
jgi:hypothetical protein